MATIKSLNEDIALKATRECRKIVTCEEHPVIGDLGEAVYSVTAQHGQASLAQRISVNDEFGTAAPLGRCWSSLDCAGNILYKWRSSKIN